MKLKNIIVLLTVGLMGSTSEALVVKPLQQVGFLGSGYDSHTEKFANQCFTGTLIYGGDASGELQSKVKISTDTLKTKLNIKAGAKLSLEVLSAEGSTEFLASFEDNELNSTSHFLYDVTGRDAVYKDLGLNAQGQRILAQAMEQGSLAAQQKYFYDNCGDEVVDRIELGAGLIVSIDFRFSDRDVKTNFKSKAKVDLVELISAESEIEADLKVFSKDVKVYISAKQKGGNPAKLGKIFTDIDPNNKSSVIDCSLANLAPCKEAYKKIEQYAANETWGFGSQIGDMSYNVSSPVGPAFLTYFTRPVNSLGIPELMVFNEKSILAAEVQTARQDIIRAYLKYTRDREKANYLLDEAISVSDSQREEVVDIKKIIEKNRGVLRSTLAACQRNLNECVTAEANMSLENYDSSKLEKVMEFFDYCKIPDLGLHFTLTVEAIKNQLDLDEDLKKDCKFLHTQHIPHVTRLDLSNSNLVDLRPLRGFKRLRRINLENNNLSNLSSLKMFPDLREINVSQNKVNSLAWVKEMDKLKKLDISYNEIDSFEPLKSLPELSILRAFGNDIDDDGQVGTPIDQELAEYEMGDLPIENKIITVNQLCQVERDWLLQINKISMVEHQKRSTDNMVPEYKNASQADNSPIVGWFMCRFAHKLIPQRAEWDFGLPKVENLVESR